MIKSLTSLRGIFILFIFFHHCMNLYLGGGSMAVAFFFVLGGFAMTLGYKDRVLSPDFRYKQFLAKRFIKFYPLHWLCILALIPLVVLSFSWKKIPILALNTVLLQTWIPLKWVYFSYNAVSWYLADTIFFAVMFPLLSKWIIVSSPKGRIGIASFFAILYFLIATLLPKEWYHAILYISPYMRLTDFVLGIYSALFYFKLKEQPEKWWNGCVAGQLIIFALIVMLVVESCILPENARMVAPVYWIMVVAVILIASLIKRAGGILLENRFLQRLGELSFIIFMIHQIILRYTTLIFKLLNFENTVIYISFTLLLTILISHTVDRYFLKPVTKWLTKKIQPSMTARSSNYQR